MNYQLRRKKLFNKMKKEGVDTLLVSNLINIFYLTGFKSSRIFLLLIKNEIFLFTDFRYEEAARKLCEKEQINFVLLNKKPTVLIKNIAKSFQVNHIFFEADDLKVADFNLLKRGTPRIKWTEAKPWIQEIRNRKDNDEIAAIKKAVRVAEKAFKSIKKSEWIGLTEIDAADLLAEKIKLEGKKIGARAIPSFDFVVAAGKNAAVPHHAPDKTIIKNNSFLKIDWGAKVENYCSDMTRTIFFGKPTAKFKEIYNIVWEANIAAISAVRSGVILENIDAAARQVISDAGYGQYFRHGTGHAVGLEVHDGVGPFYGCKTRAKKGMIITIEPGIYIPDWGGVRIEDMILVTPVGAEVLTSLPK